MSTNQYSDRAPSAQRTSSFGNFIKRTKSTDILTNSGRASPGPGTLLREKSRESDPRPSIPATPPALPALASAPVIESFGGEDYVPTSAMSPKPSDGHYGASSTPSAPSSTNDHHVREHSMTNRSRYSYAHSISSSLASPRRVRRRKDPNPYNILVIGAKNSGKTSFINFLKSSLAMPPHKQALRNQESEYTSTIPKTFHNFTHHYQEIDIDHERVGLTLWDSEGLEKGLIDLQLRDLTSFVESKFEETFAEENKVLRSPGARDTQIHVIFMILDPSRLATNLTLAENSSSSNLSRGGKTTRIVGALDEDFELQVLRSFQGKATVVPVISKADTVSTAQMSHLKKTVWQGFKQTGLDPLEALNIVQESDEEVDEEDEDDGRHGHHGSEDNSPPVTPHSDDSEAFHDTNDGQTKQQSTHKRNVSKTSISSQMMDTGYVPMSILSPDDYSLDPYTGRIGRRFPWGFADPYDPAHCDFVKLKEAVFNEWRNEVREASREIFYERWRTHRLNRKVTAPRVQSPSPVQTRKPSGGIPIELRSEKSRTGMF